MPRVHRPRQPHHVVEAFALQELLQLQGRHQGRLRAVVEAAHPAQGRALQPRRAVVAHVVVEAGVEAGGGGDAELARGAQRGPAERAFGGHVDRIRTYQLPALAQGAGRGQAELQAGIAGQGGAADQQDMFGKSRRGEVGVAVLARADQFDVVAAVAQALFQPLHGEGDAVDFRRVGLGDRVETGKGKGGQVQFAGRTEPDPLSPPFHPFPLFAPDFPRFVATRLDDPGLFVLY